MSLRIALELHLKHQLLWGLERVYKTQVAENLLGVTRQLFQRLKGPAGMQQPR